MYEVKDININGFYHRTIPSECVRCVSVLNQLIISGGYRILKRGGGGVMISLRWISGFWIVGDGRPLRAEFALSTVATVTRVTARYETLCRGVARNFYILGRR